MRPADTWRPETLARALLRLVKSAPPVWTGERYEKHQRMLAKTETIAALGCDGLTRRERLLLIESMRTFACVPPAVLAATYDAIAAAEDARLADLDAMARPPRSHATVIRGSAPKRARAVGYNDRLREIVAELNASLDAIACEYLLGDLGDDALTWTGLSPSAMEYDRREDVDAS